MNPSTPRSTPSLRLPLAVLAAAATLSGGSSASAQSRAQTGVSAKLMIAPYGRPRPRKPKPTGGHILGRFGPKHAQVMATSGPNSSVRNGMLRMARRAETRAKPVFQRAWVRAPSKTKLAVMARWARRPLPEDVRKFLVQALATGGHRSPPGSAARNVVEVAGLLLAREGSASAVRHLLNWSAQGKEQAEIAQRALLEYPPKSWDVRPKGEKGATSAQIQLWSRLGDLRAVPALRKALSSQSLEDRRKALLALVGMGDGYGIRVARGWAKAASKEAQALGIEALLLSAPQEARPLLLAAHKSGKAKASGSKPSKDPQAPSTWLTLALRHPHVDFVPLMGSALGKPGDQAAVLAALGAAKGPGAKVLGTFLTGHPKASDGALALMRNPSDEAADAIAGLSAKRATAAMGVLACHGRKAWLGRGPSDCLAPAKGQLAADASRSLEAQLAGFRGDHMPAEWTKDAERSSAYLRGAWASDGALPSLSKGPILEEIGALAWLEHPLAPGVSNQALVRTVERHGAAAPLALRALAMRSPRRLRSLLSSYWKSGDLDLRAHLAFGLGLSRRPGATAELLGNYRSQQSAHVRRAILRALSARRGVPRGFLFEISAIDVDQGCRRLARQALRGQSLLPRARGPWTAWVHVANGERTAPRERLLRLRLANGLVVPLLAPRHGHLVLPHLASGGAELRSTPLPAPLQSAPKQPVDKKRSASKPPVAQAPKP